MGLFGNLATVGYGGQPVTWGKSDDPFYLDKPITADPASAPSLGIPGGGDPSVGAPKPMGGGLFGKGFGNKLALAGAALSGHPELVAQFMQAQQDRLAQTADEQRKASMQWDMWQRQQQYKHDNPEPANNDTANDYAFISQHLGQDAADKYLSNLGDPIVTVQLPGNRVYSGPRSGMAAALGGGAAPAPSTKTIGGKSYYQDSNGDWYEGGGAGNGVGGFPGGR